MKAAFFTAALMLGAVAGFGEVLRFNAATDHTEVAPGEQVTITVELVIDKQIKNITAPPVPPSDAFTVLRTEQSQSSSTSIQIINGKVSNTKELHYLFTYVITPRKGGVFTFPALQALIDNKPYLTEPIAFNASAPEAPRAKVPDIRVSLSVSRQPLYIGEQAILTFKVVQRGNSPTQIERGFNGAVETLEKSFGKGVSLSRLFGSQVGQSAERVNGEMCRTFTLRWAIIPLSGGTVIVPSVPFEYAELRQVRRRSRDPFFEDFFSNDFFGQNVQAVGRTAFSNELVLRIKELPPPPAGFSGTIGRVSLSSSIDPVSVPAGGAATLKITVAASTRPGNVAEIAAPKLSNCEIFTPEKQVTVDTAPGGISTKKTYKFLLIPQEEGTIAIPPVSLTYFDPREGVYKTASSGELSLTVTPGKAGAKPQTRYLTQEEIRELGTDIRYIKTDARVRSVSEKPYRDPLFLLLYPVPFLLFIIALLYRLQSQHRETHAALYVKARALKTARKELSLLRKKGSMLNADQFLGKIAETIEHFISRKFGFIATGRTLEELKNELLNRNANREVAADLTRFIELLDSYRFGGAAFDEKSRAAVLDRAMTFMAGLEKTSKKSSPFPAAAALCIMALLCAAPSSAAPVNLWFEQANRFYSKAQYDSAAAGYEKIVSAGIASPAVYFNLGNTYFRLKKIGLARLCFEKAYKLDPTDDDIAANIKFVSFNIVDRVPEAERGFIETMLWQLHILMPLRMQLWFCLALLLAVSLLAAAALFSAGNGRLWLIYVSVLIALVFGFSGLSTGIKIYDAEKNAYAILVETSADAKNEPEGTKVLFTAHEGTKFRVRKTVEGWSLVSLPNGASGWVENKYLGRI
ncbi:MAG: BatD family protein [Chitinispirillaceae bacterium]|nr:BatD family protein [Chitinispirillaceae bacterium]